MFLGPQKCPFLRIGFKQPLIFFSKIFGKNMGGGIKKSSWGGDQDDFFQKSS
jgi:hypothetical protein